MEAPRCFDGLIERDLTAISSAMFRLLPSSLNHFSDSSLSQLIRRDMDASLTMINSLVAFSTEKNSGKFNARQTSRDRSFYSTRLHCCNIDFLLGMSIVRLFWAFKFPEISDGFQYQKSKGVQMNLKLQENSHQRTHKFRIIRSFWIRSTTLL